MEQVIIGGYYNALSTITTEYNVLCGGYSWDSDPDVAAQAISTAGTIRNLRIELNDVPGTGTYVFTLHRRVGLGAWGNTTLTCTVAADGTVASDTEHDVAVAAGDVICLECNPDSPDNTRYARWSVMFEGDTANESLTLAQCFCPNTATQYTSIMGTGSISIENDTRQICPTSGVLKNLYVQLEDDPGTDPDAYRYTLRVNGANSDDGEGNPLQCTITADSKTGNDTTHEIAVSAGDILTFSSEPLNAPSASTKAAIGMTFVANTDGESLIMGGSNTDLDDTATEYIKLVIIAGLGAWGSTEAEKYQLASACVLKKLYMLLSGDPGGTDKYTFTVRLEGASPGSGLVVEIAGGSTTGNDTTNTISVSDSEVVNMMVVPTDTPAVVDAYWGLVCFIAVGVTHEGVATLSGTGTLAGIGVGIFIGKATTSGTGTLASIGRLIAIGKATLSGVGTLAGIGRLIAIGKATLSGIGTLGAIGSFWRYGIAALSGIGTLSAAGRLIAIGKATLAGTGTLVAKAVLIVIGKATLAGTGTLAAIGVRIFVGAVTLSGVGTLVAKGVLIAIGKAVLSGVGTLAVIGRLFHYRALTLPIKSLALTLQEKSLALTLKLRRRS